MTEPLFVIKPSLLRVFDEEDSIRIARQGVALPGVYFACARPAAQLRPLVKIGFSAWDVIHRLDQETKRTGTLHTLMGYRPVRADDHGTCRQIERAYHRQWAHRCVLSEYFDIYADVSDWVTQFRLRLPVDDAALMVMLRDLRISAV
jgi:hypothetical protein